MRGTFTEKNVGTSQRSKMRKDESFCEIVYSDKEEFKSDSKGEVYDLYCWISR